MAHRRWQAFQMHLLTIWKIYDFLVAASHGTVSPSPHFLGTSLSLLALSAVCLHFPIVFA